jgi:hypothetical protein
MKILTRPFGSAFAACSLALAIGAIALPHEARADNDKKEKKQKNKDKHEEHADNGWHGQNPKSNSIVQREAVRPQVQRAAQVQARRDNGLIRYHTARSSDYGRGYNSGYGRNYYSQPRTNFSIVFGEGYRGRGYYYGPPGLSYYNEGPGIYYYPNERLIPQQYRSSYGYDRGSIRADVQEALSYRGYYRGPIDGAIGSGSRRAIANFQADYGLRVNGQITQELVATLGL